MRNSNSMAADDVESPQLDYLHPEIFSREMLMHILTQRGLQLNQFEDKVTLVDMYYKHVIPLPQRRYRPNRRGKLMVKKQQLKRKLTTPVGAVDAKKRLTEESSHTTMASTLTKSTETRLKPPPSLISTDKKTIKLNKHTSSELSNIHIKTIDRKKHEQKATVNTDEVNKEVHKTSTVLETLKVNDSDGGHTVKKVKIRRTTSESNDNSIKLVEKERLKSTSLDCTPMVHKEKSVRHDKCQQSKRDKTFDSEEVTVNNASSGQKEETIKSKFKKITISWP
ncbi:ashwin isoform X2 [Lingula anatina]|uniref:Ashwin n=1 Tax=Lingula anatina TaxID=7574 RepID=A0A1S3IP77_LINAN|nr:ashwin isoform X2 [Lingula anatina]|eukprot:XP_013399711.1 ashwin isoform X2 [Lingula anatina]